MGCNLTPFLGFITLILLPFTIIETVKYSQYNELINTTCLITKVIYPERLPLNTSDREGFIDCDCGKHCVSNLGTCISVFGTPVGIQDNNNTIMMWDDIYDKDNFCTIEEDYCINGENINNRLEAIEEATSIAQTYINLMNETIDCYINQDTNQLYFIHDFNIAPMIVLVSFLSLFFLSFCYMFYKISNPNNNKSTSHQVEG